MKDLVALVSLSRSDLFVDQRFFSSSAVAFIVRENDLKFLIQGFFVSSLSDLGRMARQGEGIDGTEIE